MVIASPLLQVNHRAAARTITNAAADDMHQRSAAQWTAQRGPDPRRHLHDWRFRRVEQRQRQLCPTRNAIQLLRLLGFVHCLVPFRLLELVCARPVGFLLRSVFGVCTAHRTGVKSLQEGINRSMLPVRPL